MAKPRVFVSSTYYDLRHVRDQVGEFITSIGFEPVLFENGSIPFDPNMALDQSCYDEVGRCHILVLIIGGRYGSPNSSDTAPKGDELERMYAHYNSITRGEFEHAIVQDLPVYIFVDEAVLSEYRTYQQNRSRSDVRYASVDSVNVFRLLEDILAKPRNNLVKGFQQADDIVDWLRDQWSGLFSVYLSRRREDKVIKGMTAQLGELERVTSTLKTYVESILRAVNPGESAKVIDEAAEKERQRTIGKLAKDEYFPWLTDDRNISAEGVLQALEDEKDNFALLAGFGFQAEDATRHIWVSPSKKYKFSADWIQELREKYGSSSRGSKKQDSSVKRSPSR